MPASLPGSGRHETWHTPFWCSSHHIADVVQAKFGLIMTDTWLMELESIAEHKFSRHIIITIPGKAFAHNIHVGAFVNEVCGIAKQAESAEARLEVIKARSLKACIQYSSETRVACQHA